MGYVPHRVTLSVAGRVPTNDPLSLDPVFLIPTASSGNVVVSTLPGVLMDSSGEQQDFPFDFWSCLFTVRIPLYYSVHVCLRPSEVQAIRRTSGVHDPDHELCRRTWSGLGRGREGSNRTQPRLLREYEGIPGSKVSTPSLSLALNGFQYVNRLLSRTLSWVQREGGQFRKGSDSTTGTRLSEYRKP